jgi:two-component system cell cycle sensor histidine kinase/response regulator CckA
MWRILSSRGNPVSATDGERVVAEHHRTGDAQILTRATLLVVDDEEMVRRLAARMLATLGYRALEARDGHEAVRVLQRDAQRIDGVLTDVAMPGIGGRQLGETILRCWPQIRVLYMSGFPVKRVVSEGAIEPTDPFIQKPFTEEQLGRKVRELLAGPIEQ